MRTATNFLVLLTMHTLLSAQALRAAPIDYRSQVRPVLEAHCFKCHGEDKQKGKLRLDTLSGDLLNDRPAAERWHDVRDALQLGDMPPEKEPALDGKDRRILVAWINQEIDALVAARKNADGRVVLRRMTRSEYQNTMSDLFGIEANYAKNLPPEGLSEDGFQNNGSALQMSELQLEYYLEAARASLRRAIVTGPEPQVFRREFTKSVKDKNRGGNLLDEDENYIAKMMEYPDEGEFLVRVRARAKLVDGRGFPQLRAALGYRADVRGPRGYLKAVDVTSEDWQTFEFKDRIEHFPMPSRTQSKFPGLLVVLDNAYAEGREKGLKKKKKKPKKKKPKKGEAVVEEPPPPPLTYPNIEIESVEFVGPVYDQWPPSHHTRILFPSPTRDSDEAAYAEKVLERFMRKAFRRPIAQDELQTYKKFFLTVSARSASFEEAMRETLAMVLISPEFLYLVEPANDSKRRVSDWELASRLSYFLWSTMPDERLMDLAQQKKLSDPKVLAAEVERMLGDERSWQFVEGFAGQWLDTGALDRVAVNPEYYPKFDNALKDSMRGETLHFFHQILSEELSALNFLDSDFTMVDEALANHYGIAGPRGSQFEKVGLEPGDQRGGVLAHGSMLLGNSTGEDSHPVKRAVWIRARLLDNPPADPPPNVPNLDSTDPNFSRLPVREQLRLHRKEASCNDCHRGIDPWGIALENYGGDGLWRDRILRKKAQGKGMEGQPVVSAATLPDGSDIAGMKDLKAYLLKSQSEQFARAFTSKLLTYALGRSLELTDENAVTQMTEKFIESNHRIDKLIELVVTSEAFQSK